MKRIQIPFSKKDVDDLLHELRRAYLNLLKGLYQTQAKGSCLFYPKFKYFHIR